MKYVGQNHHELCVNTEEAPEPGEVCVNGDFQGVKPAGNLSCAGQGGITQAGSKLIAFPTTVALFFFLSSFFFPHQRRFFSLAAPSLLISQPPAPCLSQTRLAADSALVPLSEGFVYGRVGIVRARVPFPIVQLCSQALSSTWGGCASSQAAFQGVPARQWEIKGK